MQRHWIFIGAILAGLAVSLGAFGAHGLDGFLRERHASDTELFARRIGNWNTAAAYQMYHAIGLILVGLVGLFRPSKWLNTAGWCFLIGVILFSGSLYMLVLMEKPVLGAITPLGGVGFILGWISFALGSCCLTSNADHFVELKGTTK